MKGINRLQVARKLPIQTIRNAGNGPVAIQHEIQGGLWML
jgi:hypothetical protein